MVIVITLAVSLIIINSKKDNRDNLEKLNSNSLSQNIEKNEQENLIKKLELEIPNTDIIEEEKDLKLEYVNNPTYYFTITSLYNTYIEKIGNQNKTFLKNTLSPQYIKDYKITDSNIFKLLTVPKLENNRQYYKTNIIEMLKTEIDGQIEVYIVKGNCRIVGTKTIFSVQVMFAVDTANQLYYTYPYQYLKDRGIDQLKKGDVLKNYTKENLVANEKNHYKCINKTDGQIAEEYLEHFKEQVNFYSNMIYDKIDAEYRAAKFISKEEFNQYLKENASELALIEIRRYRKDAYEDYTDFTCIDQYDNVYIFRQQGGIMRYTIFLDDYTVPTAEDLENYKDSSSYNKAIYQAKTFIKRINTKDYKNIYDHLDATFKNNHFKTLENFKTYVKENFYDCNKITIDDMQEMDNYYSFKCTITNYKNTNETKALTIIISIGDNMDYTMSFSF